MNPLRNFGIFFVVSMISSIISLMTGFNRVIVLSWSCAATVLVMIYMGQFGYLENRKQASILALMVPVIATLVVVFSK